MAAWDEGTVTNFQIVLNTPKNTYLNQATKTNTRQNFPTQKNPRNKKFQTPKNLLIIPVTWNSDYTSSPPPPPPLEGGGGKYKIFNPGLALIGLSGIGVSGVPTSDTTSPGLTKLGWKWAWVIVCNKEWLQKMARLPSLEEIVPKSPFFVRTVWFEQKIGQEIAIYGHFVP